MILLACKALNGSLALYVSLNDDRLCFESNLKNKCCVNKMLKWFFGKIIFTHRKHSQMFILSQDKISEEEIWRGAKWTDDTNIWWYKFPKVGSYLHWILKYLLFGCVEYISNLYPNLNFADNGWNRKTFREYRCSFTTKR